MATEGSTNLEDLTTCALCLETFTRPKMLPCQHSYCYSCLLLLGKDRSTITCPYCQKEHEIPASGVIGFNDNLLLNNLIGMSLPKTEVCTDCKERSSVPDECEHCGQTICHKCLVEHTKLSMELSNSLNQLKETLTTPTSQDKKQKFKAHRTSLDSERKKIAEVFKSEAVNKLFELKMLLERAKFTDDLMRVINELYEILSNENEEAKRDSYTSNLSEKIGECCTIDSLKDMKSNMTDLKTFLRLIQTNDEEFKFRYSTSPQDGSGQVEFEQAVVNVRGKYQTENIVDLISQLVRDSAEILNKHVTPTCEPRVDHVVSLPPKPRTADAKTETEERFLELGRKTVKEETLVFQDEDKKNSASASSLNQPSTYNSSSSASNDPIPSSELSTSRKRGQNELPRQVDYAGKGRTVVIGQGESVEEENRLRDPWGCAYHVERDEIFPRNKERSRNVVDWGKHRIMAYSADGRNARVFYTDVSSPWDVAVSSDGQHVYIAAHDSLIKVNMDGRHVKTIDKFTLGDFGNCWSVVCHREFTVVVDNYHQCVIVFNDRDEEVRCIGREHLIDPSSLAVSEAGRVYVTDGKSSCVKVFEWNGKYSSTFAGTGGDDDIEGIAVDGDGNVCVSRPDSSRIDVYSPRRELLTSIGGPGAGAGQLSCPQGLCLTPDGGLLVADYMNNRVQKF